MSRTFIAFVAALLLPGYAAAFELQSPQVKEGGTVGMEQVLNAFGCTGGNVSPELTWHDAPADTKSFALTVYDPDAPTGSGWWHWVIFNMPSDTNHLALGAGDPAAGKTPAGAVQSRTDFGKPGYGGPCPPEGDKPHRYIFTIYAVKVDKLDADADASAALIGFMLHFNTLASATLTATYGR